MGRKKRQRFAELNTLESVVQTQRDSIPYRLKKILSNGQANILELGCGRGEYTINLAQKMPNINFIGIDIQGERLWYGAKAAQEKKLTNVLFIRAQIENMLEYFGAAVIDEIWINFPDPFPKKGQIKKRLTSARFLNIYKTILKENGLVHLKTDDQHFFNYSTDTVRAADADIKDSVVDLYSDTNRLVTNIPTYYEKIHLAQGKIIYYLAFSFKY